jgi:hypothetical protein
MRPAFLRAVVVMCRLQFYNDAVNNEDFNLKEDFRRWRSVSGGNLFHRFISHLPIMPVASSPGNPCLQSMSMFRTCQLPWKRVAASG